jgi:hypothetical protein
MISYSAKFQMTVSRCLVTAGLTIMWVRQRPTETTVTDRTQQWVRPWRWSRWMLTPSDSAGDQPGVAERPGLSAVAARCHRNDHRIFRRSRHELQVGAIEQCLQHQQNPDAIIGCYWLWLLAPNNNLLLRLILLLVAVNYSINFPITFPINLY